MLAHLLRASRSFVGKLRLPAPAKRELQADRAGLASLDVGSESVIEASLGWLCRAQDRSASADGGVAHSFSLLSGWSASYPETTGYIIPTFLDHAERTGQEEFRRRAKAMLDWLVSIQMPDGAFQGGKIDSRPIAPVAFNTGQILLGLVSGERTFGSYREAMRRAANWLVKIQDADGCWRQGASPFAGTGDKTYDTHIAWGLLEAARIDAHSGYAEAALKNVRWALSHQRDNGWMNHCCMTDATRPLTHTLGYALRGIVEAHRYFQDRTLLRAARRLANGLQGAMRADGWLPGRLSSDWKAAAPWACLTGTAQIAHCWQLLFQATGDAAYREAAALANGYVRRTVSFDGPVDTVGAVKGSFPIDGDYFRYAYPNWAAKFLIDSLILERDCEIRSHVAAAIR